MTNYKITNITNTFGKRDINYMKTVSIEYIDGLQKKTLELKPNKSITILTNKLPLSVHRLRLRNLVIVEVGNGEVPSPSKPKKSEDKIKENTTKKTKPKYKSNTKKSTTSKKTTTKKDDDLEEKST